MEMEFLCNIPSKWKEKKINSIHDNQINCIGKAPLINYIDPMRRAIQIFNKVSTNHKNR